MRALFIALLVITVVSASLGQVRDTVVMVKNQERPAQIYSERSGTFIYPRPAPFAFITKMPRTVASSAKLAFRKQNLIPSAAIVGSTLVLIAADQSIRDGVVHFSNYLHLNSDRDYKTIVGFKLGSLEVDAYEAPQNLNTALYSIGEGSTSVFLGGGLWLYGEIAHDFRARSTSSQLMQSLLVVGITTQLMKRGFGRETPFLATQSGGVWRPFPNLKTYQHHVPKYDAYPSGHMATMMATVTVLAENYPDKRWIKPVGYSIMGLVGLAMINNGVHWMSDYPLAIGIGYVCGKATVKLNRLVSGPAAEKR